MIVGVGSYIIIHLYFPNPFGIHTVVLPILFSLMAFIIGSVVGKQRLQETVDITGL